MLVRLFLAGGGRTGPDVSPSTVGPLPLVILGIGLGVVGRLPTLVGVCSALGPIGIMNCADGDVGSGSGRLDIVVGIRTQRMGNIMCEICLRSDG